MLRPLRPGVYRGYLAVMDRTEILAKVVAVTVDQLEVKEEEVKEASSFTDDLGADSLTVVELVMAFEEAFEIEIPDEDVPQLKTVGNATDYVAGKKG